MSGGAGVGDLPITFRFHHLTRKLAKPGCRFDALLETMQPLANQPETGNGWATQERIETAIEFLELNADSRIGDFPLGARKRVALAQALVPNRMY